MLGEAFISSRKFWALKKEPGFNVLSFLSKLYILIPVSLVFLISCSSTKQHTNFRFAKKEFHIKQPTLLKTTGVYLRKTELIHEKQYYQYLRFYENGRCYVSGLLEGEPDTNSLKTTLKEYGSRTYFRNDSNNIVYEEWGGYYTGYTYVHCIVDRQGIKDIYYKPRGFTSAVAELPPTNYEFIDLKLNDKPEW